MPGKSVERVLKTPVHPGAVWAIARDFTAAWHPAIDWMKTGHDGRTRRFAVKGEDNVYEERLTYFSDSDRTLAYTALAGIEITDVGLSPVTVTPDAGFDGDLAIGEGPVVVFNPETPIHWRVATRQFATAN